MNSGTAAGPFSIYVHVPFCTRTCPYCAFYQVRYERQREEVFVSTVLEEARLARDELELQSRAVETVYWGGGTPSLLTAPAIRRLADGLAQTFGTNSTAEFTVEVNPGEASPTTLAALRAAGANRVSLGCQSFQPERLAFLGRLHTAEQSRRAARDAREAGFDNLSIDLIFNLPPELPPEGWRADVAEALDLSPEHLSTYGLTIEPQTSFATRAARGRLTLLDPDAYAEEYLWTCRALVDAGYQHYETSSFAKPRRESRHNRRYWTGGDYVGLGPAAHSFVRGRRSANVSSLEDWIAGVRSGRPRRDEEGALPAASRYAEMLYLGLRSRAGVRRKALRGDPRSLEGFTRALVETELAVAEGEVLALTDPGHLVLDEIVARLLALDGPALDPVGDPAFNLVAVPGVGINTGTRGPGLHGRPSDPEDE